MINVLSINVYKIKAELKIKQSVIGNMKYCIMSSKTFELLKSQFFIELTHTLDGSHKIFGLDIAICEDLKLGEVDIV